MDEIVQAAVLDDLEGAGQAKRLTARVCAEIHNAIRLYAWGRFAEKNAGEPKLVSESNFLPVRVPRVSSEQKVVDQRTKVDQELHSMMSAMCGF